MQMLIAVASRHSGQKRKKAQHRCAWGRLPEPELGLVIAARINYAKHSPNIGTSIGYRKKERRMLKKNAVQPKWCSEPFVCARPTVTQRRNAALAVHTPPATATDPLLRPRAVRGEGGFKAAAAAKVDVIITHRSKPTSATRSSPPILATLPIPVLN